MLTNIVSHVTLITQNDIHSFVTLETAKQIPKNHHNLVPPQGHNLNTSLKYNKDK